MVPSHFRPRKKTSSVAIVLFVAVGIGAIVGTIWFIRSPSAKATLASFTDPNKRAVNDALMKAMSRTVPLTGESVVDDYEILLWHEPRDAFGIFVFGGNRPHVVQEKGQAIQVDYRWQDRKGIWTDEQSVFVVRDGRVYEIIDGRTMRYANETNDQAEQRSGQYPGLRLPGLK